MTGERGAPFPAGCGFLEPAEIDALLVDELSTERLEEFERHADSGCSACLLLSADLESYAEIVRHGPLDAERQAEERGHEVTRARLVRALRSAAGEGARGSLGRWRGLMATAALLLVGALFWIVLQEQRTTTTVVNLPDGSPVRVDPRPFSAPPLVRDEQSLRSLWEVAGAAYNAGKFETAEARFAEIEEADPSQVDATIYRGVSLLLSGDPLAARETLERAGRTAREQDLSTASIDWFSAMAALAGEAPDEARSHLEALRESGGLYAEEAERLLARFPND